MSNETYQVEAHEMIGVLRRRNNLSQKDIASQLCLSPSTIAKMEVGEYSTDKLVKVMSCLQSLERLRQQREAEHAQKMKEVEKSQQEAIIQSLSEAGNLRRNRKKNRGS